MTKSIITTLLYFCAFLFISSCKEDSDKLDSVLFGTWNVTKVQGQQFNNGTPGIVLTDNNPTGYVRFDEDGSGQQNYSFTLFGTTYPFVNDFLWEADETEIRVDRFNEPDMVWTRKTNLPDKQEATYRTVSNSTQYFDYTLTLER